MSKRLYYNDSFLREFDTRVISCERAPANPTGGAESKWWVALEETAFYPTSGGQPHDTGRLDTAAVVEVFEKDNGQIVHVTDRALAPGAVHGSIDWARRFDHMQQHTGSHVLTAAFVTILGAPPVSFHLGKTVSTLDVAGSCPSAAQLEQIERLANEIIFEDAAVQVVNGTSAELASLGVRNELDRGGILRAVKIEGVDIQSCGGTHVSQTGQIGLILLRRLKKVRENWRVEFVCGQRARQAARSDFAMLEDISQRLTCAPDTIHAGITRMISERNAASRMGQRYLAESAALQAELLLAEERGWHRAGITRTVTGTLPDADMEYLRAVAKIIIGEPGVMALLGSESNGNIVMAKSEGTAGDVSALLREAVASYGGKGGGSKDFAQGSVPEGSEVHHVLKAAAERISRPVPALQVVRRNSSEAHQQSDGWRIDEEVRS